MNHKMRKLSAARAKIALRSAYGMSKDSTPSVREMLLDLRHFCYAKGINILALQTEAEQNFLEELE